MDEPNKLTSETLKKLLQGQAKAPAVTIYLPTHRSASPPNMSEDEIRLKNLGSKAAEIIQTREDGRTFQKEFCDKIDRLLNDRSFFEHQTEGLLICSRPGEFEMFFLPIDTDEYVAVSDLYHLAPVFGLLNDFTDYYVLTVAQHNPALLKGDMYGLYPTTLELPSSLIDGLNIDEMGQENEQQKSAYGGTTGAGGSGYNGRGGDKNPAEEERQRFWRMIDKLVIDHTDRKLPLILAGIGSEIAEYKQQTNYPNVVKKHVEGSFDGVNPNNLFEPAFDILKSEIINPAHDHTISEYERLSGQSPEMTAYDFASITDAANEGRISTLLLAGIRFTRDTIRDNTKPVPVLSFPPEESAQAIQEVARTVWDAGGSIVNIEREHMPKDNAEMLAIMRY